VDDTKKALLIGLKKINKEYSTKMMFYHGLTTSPLKNIVYAF